MKQNTEKPIHSIEQEPKTFVSLEPKLSTKEMQKMDEDAKYFETRAKYMFEESARIAEDIDRRAEGARFDESRTMKNESHDHQHNTNKHSAKYEKDLTGHMDDNNTD